MRTPVFDLCCSLYYREQVLGAGSIRHVPIQAMLHDLCLSVCIFYVLQRTGIGHWVYQRCTRPSVSSPRPTRTPWPSSSSIYSGNNFYPHPLTLPHYPLLTPSSYSINLGNKSHSSFTVLYNVWGFLI